MPIDLDRLNATIQQQYNNNQGVSLFRIALGLTPEECEAIRDAQGPEGIAWARMAAWFCDFFHGSRGNNYIKCSWDSKRERPTAEAVWRIVFGTEMNPNAFLSQCWALSYDELSTGGASGQTSQIWKAGWTQLLKIGANEWSNLDNYDNPPQYLKLLLENLDTATGRDFAEFIEDYLAGQNMPGKWYEPLFKSCVSYFQKRARFGEYLFWWGGEGQKSNGIGIGVDHVRGRGQAWKLDGEEQPRRAGFYPLSGRQAKVNINGEHYEVSTQVKGVFYRYVSNARDLLRYPWWKRISSSPDMPLSTGRKKVLNSNTSIPAGRSEVLVCYDGQQEVNPQPEDGVTLSGIERFTLPYKTGDENGYCPAIRFYITSRPARTTTLQLAEGWSVKLAGKVPQIVTAKGETDFNTVEEIPVCTGECCFQVSDVPEGKACIWHCRIDGEDFPPRQEVEYVLSTQDLTPGFHDVQLSVRIEGSGIRALYSRFLWVPQDVAQALKDESDFPARWQRKPPETERETIDNRLQGQIRYNLMDGVGRHEIIVAPAKGLDFWFVNSLENVDAESRINVPKEFAGRGDIQTWTLIIPGNIDEPQCEIAGQPVTTSRDWLCDYVGRQLPIWRIPLEDLFAGQEHDYTHSDNPQIAEIRCKGKRVASFRDVPSKAVLCQDDYNRWGVYIPSNDTGRYTAILYTDNTLNPNFPRAYRHDNLSAAGEQGCFHLLEDRIAQVKREDTEGELFLALIPDGELTDFGIAIEKQYPIRVVRSLANRAYGAEQDHDKLQVLHQRVKWALSRHPSQKTADLANSRLARYQRPVTVALARQIWEAFCLRDQLDDLENEMSDLLAEGYNFLLDPYWYFHAAEQLEDGLRKARGPRMHVHQPVQVILQNSCSVLLGQQALDRLPFERRGNSRPFFDTPFQNFGIQCCLPGGKVFTLTEMQESGKGRYFTLAVHELRRKGNHWVAGLKRSLCYQWNSKNNTWFLAFANYCDDIQTPALQFQFGNAEEYIRHAIDDGKMDREADLFRREQVTAQELNRVANDFRAAFSDARIFRNGLDNMVIEVIDALSKGTYAGWPDSRVVFLAGLATATTHAAFRGGDVPETWFLRHGSEAYRTLAQVTRICFRKKRSGGKPLLGKADGRNSFVDAHFGEFERRNRIPLNTKDKE